MSDFLDELRQNWSDPYWWDGPRELLLVVAAGVLAGLVSLVFAYFEARVRAAAAA